MGNTLSHSLKFKKYKRILKEKVSFSPLAGVFLKQKKYIRNTFFFWSVLHVYLCFWVMVTMTTSYNKLPNINQIRIYCQMFGITNHEFSKRNLKAEIKQQQICHCIIPGLKYVLYIKLHINNQKQRLGKKLCLVFQWQEQHALLFPTIIKTSTNRSPGPYALVEWILWSTWIARNFTKGCREIELIFQIFCKYILTKILP